MHRRQRGPWTDRGRVLGRKKEAMKMTEAVVVAAMSLLGTLLGSLAGVVTSSKLVNYRLEQLERKVQAHNNLIERTFQLEAAQALQAQRLDRLEQRS